MEEFQHAFLETCQIEYGQLDDYDYRLRNRLRSLGIDYQSVELYNCTEEWNFHVAFPQCAEFLNYGLYSILNDSMAFSNYYTMCYRTDVSKMS